MTRSARLGDLVAVSVVVGVAASAGALVAWSTAAPAPAPPEGERFAATDGSVSVAALVNAAGDGLLVQEHQRSRGFDGLSTLPPAVGAELFSAIDPDDLDETEIWRVTSRQLIDATVGPVTTDVYTVDDGGVHRRASVGGPYPSLFDPPLLVVPAEPRPGDRWTASGSALFDGAVSYEYEGSITDVDDRGCVDVTTRLALDLSGEPFSSLSSEDRWCPGLGPVAGSGTYELVGTVEEFSYSEPDDPITALTSVGRPPAPPGEPTSDPITWTSWPHNAVHRDPYFGDLPTNGITDLAPVVSADGLVIISLSNGSDLLGLRIAPAPEDDPDPAPRLVEQWRAHPGGDVLAVGVLDDLVVVSTVDRTLAAYDLDGVRRWTARSADLVLQPAVRVGAGGPDDLVVTHDLSGNLIGRRARDGSVVWRSATRADSDLAPVLAGDLLVAADRSGEVVGLDPATGRTRWTSTFDGVDAIGTAGDLVVVDGSDGTVRGITAGGSERWSADVDVWRAAVDHAGGNVVLIGQDEVVGLDPDDGSERFRIPSTTAADAWEDGLAVRSEEEICSHDTDDGSVERCWPVEASADGANVHLVATPSGIWSVDSNLRFVRIGPDDEALG